MHPAIFLDRDGVIVENRSTYIQSWQDMDFIPGALAALTRLSSCPLKIVIVTNQSAVGRGIISQTRAEEINQQLILEIEKTGGHIDGIYMCPHRPEEGCKCRKPQPGLILKAAQDHSIDLSKSIIIGDALTDLEAGMNAGINQLVLVLTGRGYQQSRLPGAASLKPFTVFDTLGDAARALIHNQNKTDLDPDA
jgi:D-glycero-D-manno-heptose 1,7-bisphosphate phosphatase